VTPQGIQFHAVVYWVYWNYTCWVICDAFFIPERLSKGQIPLGPASLQPTPRLAVPLHIGQISLGVFQLGILTSYSGHMGQAAFLNYSFKSPPETGWEPHDPSSNPPLIFNKQIYLCWMLFYVIFAVNLTKSQEGTNGRPVAWSVLGGWNEDSFAPPSAYPAARPQNTTSWVFMVMGNWENAASYYMFQTLNHGIQ